MGQAAAAGGASIVSLGLTAASDVMKGEAQQSADEFQADRAERAAQFGRLNASMTNATYRERLNTTLGNIDVIRAAAHIDPTSPTTMAVEAWNRKLSDRQRTAAVVSLNAQADEDQASASYLRKAGDFALMQGYLSAATDVASGVAKGASAGTFSLGS